MVHEKPFIALEQFEGPYDLLLELIEQQTLDISTLSLTKITDDFLSYVQQGTATPELKADFLVVAATLLLLKMKRAVPSLDEEEEEEIIELTDRVKIYALYREAAQNIGGRWRFGRLLPAGFWGTGSPRMLTPISFPDITVDTLATSMNVVIASIRIPAAPTAHLVVTGRSLADSLSLFEERLKKVSRLVFHEAVASDHPQDVAVSFLAILEMARQKSVQLHQKDHFDSIMIEKHTHGRSNKKD